MDIANLSLAAKAGIGFAALGVVAGTSVLINGDREPVTEIVECDSYEFRHMGGVMIAQYYAQKDGYHVDDIESEIVEGPYWMSGSKERGWIKCGMAVNANLPNGVNTEHKIRIKQKYRNYSKRDETVFELTKVW